MKISQRIGSYLNVTGLVVGVILVASLLNGCGGGKPSETPEAALERYIKAAQAKEFKTLYEMDYVPQRQAVLIYRAGSGQVERLGRTGLPLGRLPGDIRIEREGFSCFVPIATSILISLLLTLLLNLVIRWLGRK